MPVQTQEKQEKIASFADHVREYFEDDLDLFCQIAYMLDHTEGCSLYPRRIKDTAIELVEGGTFLVYYEDVDNFGRETKLLDMRFNQQNRWRKYVERVAHAIYKICHRIDLSFDDAMKVAERSIPNGQQRTDEDGRLWLVVTPASSFIIERLKGVNLQTCTTDCFRTDPQTLWFVIERGEQDEV